VNGMDVGLLTDIGTYVWATTVRQLTGTQTFSLTGNITGNLSGSVGSVTGAINTAAGVIQTLDALDTAQDIEHDATQATLATITGYLNTEIADILEDTGTTIPAQIAALNNLSSAQAQTAAAAALTAYDPPTHAEVTTAFTEIKGAGFSAATDTLEELGDSLAAAATALQTVDNEIGVIDGIVDNILADTNELQTDWADGGRLDLILDTAAGGGGGSQAGAGASEQTITIEDDDGDPIADVKCWITSTNDPSDNIVAGPFTTTSAGLVVLASDSSSKPMLDADTVYYLFREKDGINFENPQSFTAE
jgi:hypothetical protein